MISDPPDRNDVLCTSSESQPSCSQVPGENPPLAACSSTLATTSTVAASLRQDLATPESLPEPCRDIGSSLNRAISMTLGCKEQLVILAYHQYATLMSPKKSETAVCSSSIFVG